MDGQMDTTTKDKQAKDMDRQKATMAKDRQGI